MDELTWRVKREFLVLYSKDNFLELFHNRLRQTIYDNKFPIFSDNEDSYVINEDELIKIPKLPKLGNLDLDKIMNSKYFLS
jgi:DNA-directed RNA polymerase